MKHTRKRLFLLCAAFGLCAASLPLGCEDDIITIEFPEPDAGPDACSGGGGDAGADCSPGSGGGGGGSAP